MTELETLERARMYMEKLANGISPIDGSQIPDEDIVNNVRLSRCFFYVADVLQQVIESGGVSRQKKAKKLPFSLPLEQRGAFDFSSEPISVSEVARRINSLISAESMTKLSYVAIRDWLMELGMLEEALGDDGKASKRPTPLGESLGIVLESRTNQYGTYFTVVYNLDAQHFIMDNLDAIVEREHSKTENRGQPWLSEHDAALRELYAKGVPIKEIAHTLKRNSTAIRARLKKLGIAGQNSKRAN